MKIKVILSAVLLMLLGVGVLWAGKPWKEKPWTEWTQEDVQEILTKSPWTKKLRRRLDSGTVAARGLENPEWEERNPGPPGSLGRGNVLVVPSTGVPESTAPRPASDYRNVFVRWFSSVTVRQAIMRQGHHAGPAPQSSVDKLPDHVIAVWGGVLGFADDELRRSAHLQLGRSKQRILAARVSDTEFGLLFHFPRELNGKPIIGPQEAKVEFHCCKAEGQKPIKVTFDLRKMVRDGKPDL